MKKIIIGIIALIYIIGFSFCSCSGKKGSGDEVQKKEEPQKYTSAPKTLNISVFLDLSDRLIRDLTPNQTYRDTAIVNHLVNYFHKQTLGPAILESQNKMKVFFYPMPNDSEISILAKGLSVDIGSMPPSVVRRKALEEMDTVFPKNLARIYEETIAENKWVGCDIWDFFSSKKVDNLCVKDGARNIVVILTDGYLYAVESKIQEGCAYNYILPQTLVVNSSSLIDRRKGDLKGKGLEVLMLEVNPYQPTHRDKMVRILEDWFDAMGVEKFVVSETDANLTNTQTIIDNFLK